ARGRPRWLSATGPRTSTALRGTPLHHEEPRALPELHPDASGHRRCRRLVLRARLGLRRRLGPPRRRAGGLTMTGLLALLAIPTVILGAGLLLERLRPRPYTESDRLHEKQQARRAVRGTW